MTKNSKSSLTVKSKYRGVDADPIESEKIIQKVLKENKHFLNLLEKL
jgi:hypothetical protein